MSENRKFSLICTYLEDGLAIGGQFYVDIENVKKHTPEEVKRAGGVRFLLNLLYYEDKYWEYVLKEVANGDTGQLWGAMHYGVICISSYEAYARICNQKELIAEFDTLIDFLKKYLPKE